MNTIIVNGTKIERVGSSVVVNDNAVLVDGRIVTNVKYRKLIIIIDGGDTDLICSRNVTVKGTFYGHIDFGDMCKIRCRRGEFQILRNK